jgi:hypothetical protein
LKVVSRDGVLISLLESGPLPLLLAFVCYLTSTFYSSIQHFFCPSHYLSSKHRQKKEKVRNWKYIRSTPQEHYSHCKENTFNTSILSCIAGRTRQNQIACYFAAGTLPHYLQYCTEPRNAFSSTLHWASNGLRTKRLWWLKTLSAPISTSMRRYGASESSLVFDTMGGSYSRFRSIHIPPLPLAIVGTVRNRTVATAGSPVCATQTVAQSCSLDIGAVTLAGTLVFGFPQTPWLLPLLATEATSAATGNGVVVLVPAHVTFPLLPK